MAVFPQICLLFLLYYTSEASNCFQPDPQKLNFLCPITYAETGGFELSINLMKEVTIQCEQLNSFNVNQLPNVTLDEINLLLLRFCPLPEEGFQALFDRFGTKRVTIVQYENGDFNQTLTKASFRNLQNLEYLKLSGNKFEDIEDDVFINTPNLVALEVKENGLVQVKKEMFEGLSSLEWLDLTDNIIEVLPGGVFQKLTKLQHLRLWNNKIAKLEKSAFQGLTSLKYLDISANYIEEIPEDAFHDLRNLVNLNLATNRLKSLPADLLAQSLQLETVILNDNQGFVPSDHMFANFTSLQEVDLSFCNLQRLPETIFRNSLKLKVLSLQNNALTTLPKRLFLNLINLEVVDLAGNHLQHLDFAALRNLKMLSVRQNAITAITDESFIGLVRLEELDLSRNNISDIHPEAFSSSDGLRIINLSRNVYSGATAVFKNLVYLEEVDLSHNRLTNVEVMNLDNKPNLKKLDLSWNQIRNVSLVHLHTISNVDINLRNNNITKVSFDHVDKISGPFISTIHLGDNPLDCTCHNFDLAKYFRSTSLKMFDIRRNDVNCATPEHLKDQKLENVPLDVLQCDLKSDHCPQECDCRWRPVDATVIIDCSYRNLTRVPKIGTWTRDLEVNLSHNSLISGNFSWLGNVTRLFLKHNNLVTISGLPKSLKVLSLEYNNLTNLRPQILQTLSSGDLLNLTLDHNPWACDCDSEVLRTFLLQHPKQVDHRSVFCANTTTRLVDLNDLCSSAHIYIYSLLLSFLLSFFSLTFLIFFYIYKTEIKVWLFSKNLCLCWVSEEDLDSDKIYDAFISYSNKDGDFVVGSLVAGLQAAPENYKLCLAFRDWFPGELISSHIVNSVVESKRTIVVLSENFLGSVWAKAEFQKAHSEAMADGRLRIIVIIYGEVDVESIEDTDLKSYLRTNTYLKWGDPYFWAKLKYAMPHRRKNNVEN